MPVTAPADRRFRRAHVKPARQRKVLIARIARVARLLAAAVAVAVATPAAAAADAVLYRCLERGLSFKTTFGNVLTLTPPLIVTEADIDRALAILGAALAETAASRGAGGV